ncbi:MAG TPA: polysaccharide deacetylase family protein, partial [Rhodothermales bacterium]|nr:polysaccharide deacetylase family protein [Rhodothermales bacterium]
LRRWSTDATLTHSVRLGARLLPHVVTQAPGGALTFDDGPHPASTDALIDALGTTRGAFFLLADRADAHPALVRRLAEAGHTVALHGPAHVDLWRTRFDEPAWADARHRLEDLSGTLVRYVRPPHGHITPALFRFARRADLTVVLWDVMPGDFLGGASADSVAATTRRLSRPDSIVALHDAASTVAAVAPAVRQLVAERAWGGLL